MLCLIETKFPSCQALLIEMQGVDCSFDENAMDEIKVRAIKIRQKPSL